MYFWCGVVYVLVEYYFFGVVCLVFGIGVVDE